MTEDLADDAPPFLHLFTLLPVSASAERQQEYCMTLWLNARNAEVGHMDRP